MNCEDTPIGGMPGRCWGATGATCDRRPPGFCRRPPLMVTDPRLAEHVRSSDSVRWLARRLGRPLRCSEAALVVVLEWAGKPAHHLDGEWHRLGSGDWGARMSVRGGLATFDTPGLTGLVLAGHVLGVRVQVHPAGPKYLEIKVSPREGRTGAIWSRHPNLQQATNAFGKHSGIGAG